MLATHMGGGLFFSCLAESRSPGACRGSFPPPKFPILKLFNTIFSKKIISCLIVDYLLEFDLSLDAATSTRSDAGRLKATSETAACHAAFTKHTRNSPPPDQHAKSGRFGQ